MPATDDDDRPKRKIVHEIGQDLSLLSVEELVARIELLQQEISRLQTDIKSKNSVKSQAEAFFKK